MFAFVFYTRYMLYNTQVVKTLNNMCASCISPTKQLLVCLFVYLYCSSLYYHFVCSLLFILLFFEFCDQPVL